MKRLVESRFPMKSNQEEPGILLPAILMLPRQRMSLAGKQSSALTGCVRIPGDGRAIIQTDTAADSCCNKKHFLNKSDGLFRKCFHFIHNQDGKSMVSFVLTKPVLPPKASCAFPNTVSQSPWFWDRWCIFLTSPGLPLSANPWFSSHLKYAWFSGIWYP